jgi:hypothetical protein
VPRRRPMNSFQRTPLNPRRTENGRFPRPSTRRFAPGSAGWPAARGADLARARSLPDGDLELRGDLLRLPVFGADHQVNAAEALHRLGQVSGDGGGGVPPVTRIGSTVMWMVGWPTTRTTERDRSVHHAMCSSAARRIQ